jgi:hypothetical protein
MFASPVVAVFHEVDHGLCAAIGAVAQRLNAAVRHGALIRGSPHAPTATIKATDCQPPKVISS